jgi:hypothetical protein
MTRRIQSTCYIQPIGTDGTPLAPAGGESTLGTSNRGVYTLVAGTTYYVVLPAADALWLGLQTQGDATVVLTSVTLEECYVAESEATNYSDNIGEWLAIDIARISSEAEGTGWSATSDVIAAVGGNAGAGVQNVQDTAARRVRAKVVVGATGGEARFSAWAKE